MPPARAARSSPTVCASPFGSRNSSSAQQLARRAGRGQQHETAARRARGVERERAAAASARAARRSPPSPSSPSWNTPSRTGPFAKVKASSPSGDGEAARTDLAAQHDGQLGGAAAGEVLHGRGRPRTFFARDQRAGGELHDAAHERHAELLDAEAVRPCAPIAAHSGRFRRPAARRGRPRSGPSLAPRGIVPRALRDCRRRARRAAARSARRCRGGGSRASSGRRSGGTAAEAVRATAARSRCFMCTVSPARKSVRSRTVCATTGPSYDRRGQVEAEGLDALVPGRVHDAEVVARLRAARAGRRTRSRSARDLPPVEEVASGHSRCAGGQRRRRRGRRGEARQPVGVGGAAASTSPRAVGARTRARPPTGARVVERRHPDERCLAHPT